MKLLYEFSWTTLYENIALSHLPVSFPVTQHYMKLLYEFLWTTQQKKHLYHINNGFLEYCMRFLHTIAPKTVVYHALLYNTTVKIPLSD